MTPKDEEKMEFVMDQRLYCYKAIPFGLKKARATYQYLVNKVFSNQIDRNMEVYIDDMLVMSCKEGHHMANLEKTFQTLRTYHVQLNSDKYAFGVSFEKFLGFMVYHHRIEVNPEKAPSNPGHDIPQKSEGGPMPHETSSHTGLIHYKVW